MIIGFEELTADLSDYEKEMLPDLIRGLKTKTGVENAVKSKEMIKGMELFGWHLSGARLRKLINHIRINQLVPNLVATSKGYYIEHNKNELAKYVKSLKQRAAAIKAVAESYDL